MKYRGVSTLLEKNTKNKRLYLNRPQIAWKGISHLFPQFVTSGGKTCSIGTGKLDVGVYLRGKSRALKLLFSNGTFQSTFPDIFEAEVFFNNLLLSCVSV